MKDTDRAILEFESAHPKPSGLKENLILSELGMHVTRYYQRLVWLVRQAEVVAEYPQVASRVQRQIAKSSLSRVVHD